MAERGVIFKTCSHWDLCCGTERFVRVCIVNIVTVPGVLSLSSAVGACPGAQLGGWYVAWWWAGGQSLGEAWPELPLDRHCCVTLKGWDYMTQNNLRGDLGLTWCEMKYWLCPRWPELLEWRGIRVPPWMVFPCIQGLEIGGSSRKKEILLECRNSKSQKNLFYSPWMEDFSSVGWLNWNQFTAYNVN